MLPADLTSRHSACLHRLADRTEAMLEVAFARAMAAEGRDVLAEFALFSDLGRALRLTLALEMRLLTLKPAAAWKSQAADVRPQRSEKDGQSEEAEQPEAAEQQERADRPERPEIERERETERDRYPATALGRAEALAGLLTGNPQLDPDGRVTAEIIQIKAFLSETGPNPEPPRTQPPRPPHAASAASPGLSRPLNRAERRRLRHSSG